MMGYHITKIRNLFGEDGIASRGLVPMHGERCEKVGDERTTLCFTTDYYYLPFWREELYGDVSLEELCVLTFHLDKEECNRGYMECSTQLMIPKEELYVASFYDRDSLDDISFEKLNGEVQYDEFYQPIYTKVGIHLCSLEDYMDSLKENHAYQYLKK